MNVSFGVTDRVIVVTGASSGLGAAIAEGLADAGAQVVATARRESRLAALSARLTGVTPVVADLTDDSDRERIVALTVGKFGRIDGLVNAAGALHVVPALKETAHDLRQMLEIDLVAPLDLARRCALAMRETGGGAIVNITSMSGIVTTGQKVPSVGYCAAKAGLAHATRELAVQWGQYGIRVNAVAPGLVPTEMMDGRTELPDFFRRRLALPRVGDPADILAAVQYLLSDSSSYVTGQELAVDGGRTVT